MKIAVVGKGGSGKSSMSRLMTQYIFHTQKNILAIDSDHNMDFMDILGVQIDHTTPTFKDNYDDIFAYLGYDKQVKARKLIQDLYHTTHFCLSPLDTFSQKVLFPIAQSTYTLLGGVVGLGLDDVMGGGRCAHAVSNPLRIYLSLLDAGKYDLVVDGVAGVDMINHGLYHGCDFILIVVECSKNSCKVAEQIAHLCDMSHLNYGFIINKYTDNQYIQSFLERHKQLVLGIIQHDIGCSTYDYTQIGQESIDIIGGIYKKISNTQGYTRIQRIAKIEEMKGPIQ